MTGALYYPPADRESQTYPGFWDMTPEKVVLHTTETAGGWPGYSSGSNAPHFTFNPISRQWRQHIRVNRSAGAMMDPSNTKVRENRDGAIQVELTLYCDPKYKTSQYSIYRWQPGWTDDIARFLAWVHREHGIPFTVPPVWWPYPKSAGDNDYQTRNYGQTIRFDGPGYDSFRGVMGHQHAPWNDHGDPGAIPIVDIIRVAKGYAGDTPPPPGGGGGGGGSAPGEDDMSDAQYNELNGKLDVLLGRIGGNDSAQIDAIHGFSSQAAARLPSNTPQVLGRLDARVSPELSASARWTYDAVRTVVIPLLQELAATSPVEQAKLDQIIAQLDQLDDPEPVEGPQE